MSVKERGGFETACYGDVLAMAERINDIRKPYCMHLAGEDVDAGSARDRGKQQRVHAAHAPGRKRAARRALHLGVVDNLVRLVQRVCRGRSQHRAQRGPPQPRPIHLVLAARHVPCAGRADDQHAEPRL